MLPTVLENLIGTFAYGQETPLSEELETLIKFRECVPPCLLLPEVSWLDPHRHGRCLNPWYRGMPYTPFGLLGHDPPFVPGMLYLSRSMCKQVFSELHTYPKVFQRHLNQFYRGNPCSWNKALAFLLRLQAQVWPGYRDPRSLLEVLVEQLEGAQLLPACFSVPWLAVAKSSISSSARSR